MARRKAWFEGPSILLRMKSGRRAATSATMPIDVGVADGKATLADDLAARLGDDLAREAVHLPAPDIVRSGQIDAPPVGRQHVLEERQEVLVRTGARVDHVRVGLEAFVGANVPEQGVVLLDDGNDVLARLRGHRADHVPAPVLLEHLPGQFDVELARSGRISEDRLDRDGARRLAVPRSRSSRRHGNLARARHSRRRSRRGCRDAKTSYRLNENAPRCSPVEELRRGAQMPKPLRAKCSPISPN